MDNTQELDLSHHMPVAKLRELLGLLRDTDELWPNGVGNLTIVREDEIWGAINFLNECASVEWFNDDESPEVANA